MRKSRNKSSVNQHVGCWQMVRDVLIASLNRGQFIPALLGMIFVVMILRMPPEDVSQLVFEIHRNIVNASLVGYFLGMLAISGWFIHSRWQRKLIDREMKRIAEERNKWQEHNLGNRIKSSEK